MGCWRPEVHSSLGLNPWRGRRQLPCFSWHSWRSYIMSVGSRTRNVHYRWSSLQWMINPSQMTSGDPAASWTWTKKPSLSLSLRSCGSYTTLRRDLVQFSSVTWSCPTLCNPMNWSTPGLPVHHQHPEFTQTHVHRVGDAIQPSHPLLSPSPPAPNPSQHQSLFQRVNSSHEVAKVLELQLQHQSFQWIPRTDLL